MSDRKFFVGGNFKMNGDKASLDAIVANLNKINSPNTGKKTLYLFYLLVVSNLYV